MLHFFSKKLKTFGYFMFGLIIIAFVFVVPGGMDDKGNTTILAKVGDDEILLVNYWSRLQNEENAWRESKGESVKDKDREQFKMDVLARLLYDSTIIQVAAQEGITVTNKEIEDAIKSEQAFWRDGAFDSQLFDAVLRQNYITRKSYINSRRKDLIKDKVLGLADSISTLTPEEIKTIEGLESENIESIKQQYLSSKQDMLRLSYAEGLKGGFLVTYNLDLIKGK